MRRRFEFTGTTSGKYWEVTVTRSKVTVHFGRLGTSGQRQTKTYPSPDAARKAAARQIAEKERKGYREFGDASPASRTAEQVPKLSSAASASVGGADRKQLAAVRKLIGQDDAKAVQQGLALLEAVNDPAIWTIFADGVHVDKAGMVIIAPGSEVHKRVKASYRVLVALWAIANSGNANEIRELDVKENLDVMVPLLKHFGALRELSVRGFGQARLKDLAYGPQLEDLTFWHCEELTSLTGVEHCPRLTKLHLSGCVALQSLAGLAACPHLKSLFLSGDGYNPRKGALTSLAGLGECRQLEELQIMELSLPSLVGIGECQQLKTLGLWNVAVTSLTDLGDCPQLETLELTKCTALTSLAGLEHCAQLRTLKLFDSALTDYSALRSCASLKTLDLTHESRFPWEVRERLTGKPLAAFLRSIEAFSADLNGTTRPRPSRRTW